MGNRQPIKQFKPSPRVGMAAGASNAPAGNAGTGVPMRPGTAGGNTTAGGLMSAGYNKGQQPNSSKGF